MHLHMVSMGWKWATLGSILEEGRAGLAFLHFTQCHSEVKKTNKQKTLDAQDQKESWQTLMCSQWGWHWTCYSSLALMAGANTAARAQPEVRWAWAWSLCKCPPHQHCSGAHHSSAVSPASGPLCPSLCRRCRCCRSSSSPPADLGRNAQSPLTLERPSLQKASR